MCSAFDWPPLNRNEEPPLFYPNDFVTQLPPLLLEGLKKTAHGDPAPYILCFHATARAAKRWPNEHWVELGQVLSSQGYQLIFPWGNPEEMKVSAHIANQIPGAIVPRAFSIEEAYSLIAHAALTIGVDTGLTHLSAVLVKPTVEIYCDSLRWKTEGYWSKAIANVGDYKNSPLVEEVEHAVRTAKTI
jgi:heptosyltransferase-1